MNPHPPALSITVDRFDDAPDLPTTAVSVPLAHPLPGVVANVPAVCHAPVGASFSSIAGATTAEAQAAEAQAAGADAEAQHAEKHIDGGDGEDGGQGYTEEVDEEGVRMFRCADCDSWFTHRGMMNRHRLKHERRSGRRALRKFACATCGQQFVYRSSLVRHEARMHSHRMPYKCKECGKRFRHPTCLEVHMLIHNESREHTCAICSKAFRTKCKLTEHLRGHQVSTKNILRCPRGCGQEFVNIKAWEEHRRNCNHEQVDAEPIEARPRGATQNAHSTRIIGSSLVATRTL